MRGNAARPLSAGQRAHALPMQVPGQEEPWPPGCSSSISSSFSSLASVRGAGTIAVTGRPRRSTRLIGSRRRPSCLLGQRRDDDLVEAAVADGRLDGCDRIGAPDEAVDATLRLPRERVNRRSPQGRCARPGQAPVTRQHLVRRHRAARTLASAAPVAHARLKQARRSCTPKPRLRLRKSSERRALP